MFSRTGWGIGELSFRGPSLQAVLAAGADTLELDAGVCWACWAAPTLPT
ncbi:hypothetical protein [Amycolatopsis sp. NPDC051371]